MIPIELKKRYPHSREEDITDAFMRGYQACAAQGGDAEMDNCQVQAPQNYMQQSRHDDGRMTREEAIHRLKNTAWLGTNKDREETEQAVDMAIEALSANDEINEMNRNIIKDILKMIPTAYLLEALGVDTFEELTEMGGDDE